MSSTQARQGRSARSTKACNSNSNSSIANETQCLEQYKSIRQLIAGGSFKDALHQGYLLLQQVTAALSGGDNNSRCLGDLLVGSTLNVVICTAEARPTDLADLPRLNAAVSGLLSALRQQAPSSAAQNAGTLAKCLLKAVTAVGQEVAAQCKDHDAPNHLEAELQQLLASLVAAAHLSGLAGLPQQVAVKACQQLPACLQHCVLVALRQAACLPLAAAPLTSSRSSKAAQADSTAGDCLGVPLAVLLVCLQQVAAHVQLRADSMSACVDSLLTHECGPEEALLQGSIVLLLAAMCSSCGAGLSQEVNTALAAAAEASAQHVKQQLQQLEVGGAEAGVCWLQCPDAAEEQQALLRLQAWATTQLSAEVPPSVNQLAVSLASYHVVTWQHTATDQVPTGPTAMLIASMLASTAGCVARCWLTGGQGAGSCSLSAAAAAAESRGAASSAGGRGKAHGSRSSSSSKQFNIALKNGPLLQLQQQLTAAVSQLIGWRDLQGAAHQQSTCSSACDTAAVELLADKLQSVALSVSSAVAAAEGAWCSSSHEFAAALWLQVVMCRFAAAVAHSGLGDTARAASPGSKEAADTASRTVQAAAAFLQAIKPYITLACAACKAAAAPAGKGTSVLGSANTPAASVAAERPAECSSCTACCICASIQGVMLLAAGLVLQLADSEQQAVRQQWQSTLRSYSRLRCVADGCLCATVSVLPGNQARSKHQQGTLSLCSVLQLASEAATGEACSLPLHRLCWLEGGALSQIAAAGVAGQSVAAVQLLQELSAYSASISSGLTGQDQGEALMATGMLQLLLTACPPVGCGSSAAAAPGENAQVVLTEACQSFMSVLQPAASPPPTAGASGAPSKKGRRAAGAKQPKQQQPSGVSRGKSPGAAAGSQQHWEAADPDTLLAAALCHCLLGVVLAQKGVGGEGAQGTGSGPARDAKGAVQQGHQGLAAEVATEEDADSTVHHDNSSSGGSGSTVPAGVVAAWQQAGGYLQDSLALFEAHMAATKANSSAKPPNKQDSRRGSSGSCSSGALWYAEEAVVVVLQAWHLAAQQDWVHIHQASLAVLEHLSGALSQQARQQLAPLLALMQDGRSSAGCAGLLLLVQGLLLSGLEAAGSAGSSSSHGSEADSMGAECTNTSCPATAQQQLPACACELQARAQALHALGTHSSQPAESAFGGQLLQQVKEELGAAEAAGWAGDTAAAAAGVEEALRRCKLVLSSGCTQSGSGGTACMSLAGACSAGMRSHALGLYMTGLWQLAWVQDAAGNPTDAVRALKQLHKLSCSASCYSVAALAQANLSSVSSRMSQPKKAAAAAAAAMQLLEVVGELRDSSHQEQGQHFAVATLAAAAVASAQAAVASASGQLPEAERRLQEGISVLQEWADGASGPSQGLWLVAQHAQMLLQLAICRQQQQDEEGAVAVLAEASAMLEAAGQASCQRHVRCPCGPWPTTWSSVQLELLSLRQPVWPSDSCAGSDGLTLVGFQSGSHNNDLLAEFASAADTQGGIPQSGTSTASNSRRQQPKSSASAPPQAAAGGGASEDKPGAGRGRRGKAAGVAAVRLSGSKPGSSGGTSSAGSSAEAVADPAAWLCSVLQAARYCSQQPLLLRRAGGMLSGALAAVGAVQGALVFHHMALGASATQRQLMLAVSKQHHPEGASAQEQKASASSVSSSYASSRPHLCYGEVLQQVAAAAQQCCQSSNPPSVNLQRVAKAVDQAGDAWLVAMLQQLPRGIAVCSVSRQPCGGGPGVCGSDGLLLSRVLLDEEGGLGTALLVQLPGRAADGTSPGEQMHMSDMLAGVQTVLSDASASMAAASSGSLSTGAGKSAWWQQRVGQDQRMARLVQQLDKQWLGPWRCLLMQPGQAAVEEAAAAAGQAIVSEHFDSVLDDKSKQLLGQMLALLVGHLDSCATAELAAAVQDLSTLAQQRMDGLHLQRLLSDMEAAHAAVKAAAAATDTQQSSAAAAAGAGRRSSAGLVSGMKGLSIAQADGGLSSTTPARRPLQALQGSATPCGASRSSRVVVPSCTAAAALQQAARGSKARAAVGDAEQQGEASSSIAGPAGPLGAAVAVPPSIARHASRRSRLKGLTSSVPAISEGLTSTSSAGTLRMGADKTAVKPQRKQLTGRQAEAELFGDVRPCTSPAADDVAMPSCSSSSASQQPPPSVPVKGRRGVSSAGLGRIAGQAGTAAAAGADCGQLGSRQAAVILVLGDGLQQLPWESCAGLREVNMCRCPGLAFAAGLAAKLKGPAVPGAVQGGPQPLQLSASFYLLNPDGDLPDTQQTFEAQLQQLCREGVAGNRPAPAQLLSAVQEHDLFLYFGHGAGEQYLPRSSWHGLERCAGSLLMGCSSGKLRPAGEYEAHGPVWDYLMAGAPVVVGNLWDVTDRDIDRFAARVLQHWCDTQAEPQPGTQPQSSARASSNNSSSGVGSSSLRCGSSGLQEAVSVSQSLALSRQACRLPTLIGSAAVCFGLPAVVQPQLNDTA